jgi:NADP-dependent 3-hydroxy acid dehydrogenase YdfG
VPTLPRPVDRLTPEALQITQRVVAEEHHFSAAPAVATVGTAPRHVRLASEARTPVPSGAGLQMDSRVVMQHAGIVTASSPAEVSCIREAGRTISVGHVFLITGASSGIGAATARQAAQAGYRLVLAARSTDKLESLAAELGGPERALAVGCDVTSWEDQQRMVQSALDAFGQIDVAFANAGFGGPRGFLKDTPEHWREMVLTNVYGAALTLRATIPALTDSRGHLLLTSSVAGRRVLPGSMYSTTKHAVTAMGEAARQDLTGTGVRVTLIEPGMVDTPFFENRPSEALEPEDIARAVLYAVSQPPHVNVNEMLIRPTAQEG